MIQPLSFSDNLSLEKCNCKCELIYDYKHLPSFVITRPTNINTNFDIFTIDENGNETLLTTYNLPKIFSANDGTDYIMWKEPRINQQPCGKFIIKITDGTNIWYSDCYVNFKGFETNDITYNKICYNHSCNANNIPYSQYPDFCFCFYLENPSGICKPAYEYDSEVDEDNLKNNNFKLKQSRKVYKLNTSFIYENITDVLAELYTVDNVIFYPKKDESFKVEEIIIEEPNWSKSGCTANLEIKFYKETKSITTSCCDDLGTECIECTDIRQNTTAEFQDIYESQANVNDCYFIKEADLQTNNEWSNNVGSVACWNGFSWEYSEPPLFACFDDTPTQLIGTLLSNTGSQLQIIDYTFVPFIYNVINNLPPVGIGSVFVQGIIPNNTFGNITIFDCNTNAIITSKNATQQELTNGVEFTLTTGNCYRIKLSFWSHGCTYEYYNDFELNT